eukprot:415328_1
MHASVSNGTQCQPSLSRNSYGSISKGISYHVSIAFNSHLVSRQPSTSPIIHPSDAPATHTPTTAAPTTHPSETPTTTHAPTQSPVTRSPTRTGQTYPPTTVCRYTLYTKTRHKGTVYTRDAYDSTYTEQLYATTTRYITSDRSIGLTRGRRDSG